MVDKRINQVSALTVLDDLLEEDHSDEENESEITRWLMCSVSIVGHIKMLTISLKKPIIS